MSSASFAAILKEHRKASALRRQELDKARLAATGALEVATGTLLYDVTQGAQQIHLTQQKLDLEAKALQAQTAAFARQTQRWIAAYREVNDALKQLGDVANWSQVIEADMRFVCRALDTAAQVTTGVAAHASAPTSAPALANASSTTTAAATAASVSTSVSTSASAFPVSGSQSSSSSSPAPSSSSASPTPSADTLPPS